MHQFNATQAKARLSELVKKALDGEDVIITKHGKPLVKLVPVRRLPRRRHPGSAKGRVIMSEDFGEPLEAMMEHSLSAVGRPSIPIRFPRLRGTAPSVPPRSGLPS